MRLLPQDIGARWTDGGSIGMRRGPAGVRGARSTPACPARLFAGVAAKCLARQNSARQRGGKTQEIRDNWANYVQLLRSAHLQSDVTAGSQRAAVCAGDAAIFSNTYEEDNPTTKLINEVEMSIMHPAVARVGSEGGDWEFRVV